MEKEVARTVGDRQTEEEAKTQKGKAKEKGKTEINHQTRANLPLGESLQVEKQMANLVLTLSRESVKKETNPTIGTNHHAEISNKGPARMVTTASFPMQSQKLE